MASSETTISVSGMEKMGGSFTSFTVTFIDVVSLNGPRLKKFESMFLFVASILREKLLLVSKSRGCKRQRKKMHVCIRGMQWLNVKVFVEKLNARVFFSQ